VFNGDTPDTAYITQLKQQKSKRCYYVGARRAAKVIAPFWFLPF